MGVRARRWLAVGAAAVLAAVGLGVSPASAAAPASGQQRALILRVTWGGADASGSNGLDSTILNGVNPWMTTASRGIFTGFTITDPGVLTIPQPALGAPGNVCDNNFLHTMEVPAEQQAQNLGLNPTSFDVLIYWFPAQSCNWGGLGDLGGLRVHLNGTVNQAVLVHELGHHLGLSHGHSLFCTDGAGNPIALSTTCGSSEYGDYVNEMGTGTGTFSALQLASLHWLDGLVPTVPATGGAFLVSPLDSQPATVHALRIPDGSETIWVEYRQPSTLDSNAGVFIHLERPDGSVTSGSYLLTMQPGNGLPQLPVGATWTNPLGHARITVDFTTAQAAHITVGTTYAQVPNLLSLTVAQARSALTAHSLVLGHQSSLNNCVDPGTVQNQSSAAGTLVDPGSSVSVTVSTCTGGGNPK